MRRLQLLPLLGLVPLFAVIGCTTRQPPVAQSTTAETAKPAAGETAMPAAGEMAMPMTKGSLKVVSPKDGEKITTTDIPAQVAVSNFKVSAADVGMPDVDGEGHIHVMLDGMNMGVLFNFYTTPKFTLPGRAMTPGPHTIVFGLASNTHEDFENTAQKVNIDYEPAKAKPAPAPVTTAGVPTVKILSPADGTTVGPQFTMQLQHADFTPALDLEGKPNIKGYGHYHVFVDMSMAPMEMSSTKMAGGGMEMMSMAGMVGMPGSDTFPVDLRAWKKGKHTITVELVQNDHTEIADAKPAMITINLKGAEQY